MYAYKQMTVWYDREQTKLSSGSLDPPVKTTKLINQNFSSIEVVQSTII